MIKRCLKLVMVLLMILGIAFSISNFIPLKLESAAKRGAWDYDQGEKKCMGMGDECSLSM